MKGDYCTIYLIVYHPEDCVGGLSNDIRLLILLSFSISSYITRGLATLYRMKDRVSHVKTFTLQTWRTKTMT